jgi:hypothetical protein
MMFKWSYIKPPPPPPILPTIPLLSSHRHLPPQPPSRSKTTPLKLSLNPHRKPAAVSTHNHTNGVVKKTKEARPKVRKSTPSSISSIQTAANSLATTPMVSSASTTATATATTTKASPAASGKGKAQNLEQQQQVQVPRKIILKIGRHHLQKNGVQQQNTS